MSRSPATFVLLLAAAFAVQTSILAQTPISEPSVKGGDSSTKPVPPSSPFTMARGTRNVTVYYEPGRYGGWPANHGIWQWGDEIVVGFTEARYVPDIKGHVNSKEVVYDRQARSMDGGLTWTVNPDRGLTPKEGGSSATSLEAAIDFTTPNTAMKFRFGDDSKGPTWFYVSHDRCKTWSGPYHFPMFGFRGVSSRSSYLVLGKRSLLVFASAAKSDGREGRPFVARTDDGGLTWRFVTWIGPEPKGYAIMPSVVRLGPSELLAEIRRKEDDGSYIDQYRSQDLGQTWTYELKSVPSTGVGANPPMLLKLKDGRLCLLYGYRGEPHSIRARLSKDLGKSWSEDIVLRDDGTENDLGYVRAVQRPDGTVVALYYFNAPVHPERTIEATMWDVSTIR